MYKPLITFHIWASVFFILVSIALTCVSVMGLIKKWKYTRKNRWLEKTYIVSLYLAAIGGISMYFMLDPENKPKMLSYAEALKNAELRFWVIEHFCIMLFAVALSHIGLIFTSHKIPDFHKYKYSSFYYGIVTLISLFVTFSYGLKQINY